MAINFSDSAPHVMGARSRSLRTTRPYAFVDRETPAGRLPLRVAWSIMIVVALGFWYGVAEFILIAWHFIAQP